MAKFTNVYPGVLILPNGTEIAKGDDVDLDKETLAIAGVAEWVDKEWLVKPGDVAKAQPSKDFETLKAALADSEKATADRDATIAKLTADLEAATKPEPKK